MLARFPILLLAAAVLYAGSLELHLQQGARAMGAGDLAVAAGHFKQALERDPKNLTALGSLALCLAGMNRFPDAAVHFEKLTKLQPAVPAPHYNLGLARLNMGDGVGAEKAFRQVLHLNPDHPKAQIQLGNSLMEQARAGDSSKMQAAASVYRKALPRNPRNPELKFNLAFALARIGDEAAALTQYAEVLRLEPKFPQAEFFLGITLFQLENWPEAAKHLSVAMEQGRKDFHLHYYLGSALLKAGTHDRAGEHLDLAAKLNPEHPGVHFQLASHARTTGDKQRAAVEQRLFRETTARSNIRWRADALSTAAQRALEQGDLKLGISALKQAHETRPTPVSARNLALSHIQSGNLPEARILLQEALKMDPKDAFSLNYLGLLEAREGNLPLASQHFEQAAALDPTLLDAVYNSAVSAFEQGRNGDAIERLRAGLKLSDSPRFREALALVLADSGRHRESQEQFDAAQKRLGAGGNQ